MAGYYVILPYWSDIFVRKLDENGNVVWGRFFDQNEYGYGNEAYSIQTTMEGGCIVGGYTSYYGAGSRDFWFIKFDSVGNILWQKTFGSAGSEIAYSLATTQDGGFIATGYTESFGAGGKDIWVLKFDHNIAIDNCNKAKKACNV